MLIVSESEYTLESQQVYVKKSGNDFNAFQSLTISCTYQQLFRLFNFETGLARVF